MKYVTPREITLSVTNVPENDYPEWVSGTSYSIGDYVIRSSLHRVYKCAVATSGTTAPEDDPTTWVDWGATNAYKIVDEFVNTQTAQAESFTFSFSESEVCDTMALFNLEAVTVRVVMNDGTADVHDETYNLDETSIADWYDYFYEDFIFRSDLYIQLPVYRNITYTVTVTNTGATAKCGLIVLGRAKDLGVTLFNPSVGILDYSKKETNEWGGTFLSKGKVAKRADCTVIMDSGFADEMNRRLAKIAGEATLFVGDEREGGYESLLIYGFYRDFDIVIANPVKSQCTLSLEGLV